MPQEQLTQVIETIPQLHIKKWKDHDIEMLFKLCYWCAWRMGEAVRLKAEDFDLSTHEVYLGKTKTEREDYASIPPMFLAELESYLKDKTGPLFPKLNLQIVGIWINRLGKMLEIPAWTTPQAITGEKTKCHIFRKSIGKDMLYGVHGRKAPLNVISSTLRHRGKNPLASTSQYLKLGIEGAKDWWYEEKTDTDQLII